MDNPVLLHLRKGRVNTPFGLLGTDENALSFSLGYTFQQCLPLLQWFLYQVEIQGIHQKVFRNTQIHLQRHQSGDSKEGITDIEIHLPGHFHVIIEAKVGLAVPTLEQCQKYLRYFQKSNAPIQKLVALVQSPDDSFKSDYIQRDPGLATRLVCFNWAEFIPQCIRLMTDKSTTTEAKSWIRHFYRFLDEEYRMKAFSTEVWILPINTTPLWPNGMSFWQIHQKYNIYFDSVSPTVRPLYLGFRVDGQVNAIYRVTRIEQAVRVIDSVPELQNIEEEWPKKRQTIWHFGPPVPLANPVITGGGMYSRRVRCDLDLLLKCKTVKEIEHEMGKRLEELVE